MKTYEINKTDIKGMEVLETGYKAIQYDNSSQQNFRYGNKGDNLVGKIFKVDGDIAECKWGLHFCKDPANVFNFYAPLGYNKYFKVRAYGKVINSQDGIKQVAQIIEFIEEYDIMQYIEIIKNYNRTSYSCAVRGSSAVSYSSAVSDSNAVSGSRAVSYSNAVSGSYAIYNSEAVKNCIFCYEVECKKYYVFNKRVKKERFEELYIRITGFNYFPKYDNFYELKGNNEWWAIAFPELMTVDNKTAWSKMPKEVDEYIRALPEFDEEIYKKITE